MYQMDSLEEQHEGKEWKLNGLAAPKWASSRESERAWANGRANECHQVLASVSKCKPMGGQASASEF